jgi:predicted PolB exonuclease-like 3'-5' exonuclease
MLIWDIETSAAPEERLRELYRAPTFEEFSSTCDKRWKDDTKREKFEKAKVDGWQSFKDKAALSAVTGQVVAVGCWSATTGKTVIVGEQEGMTEPEILAKFWGLYGSMRSQQRKMVGVNICGFDLPFLVRRSWILGVDIPATVRDGRYWDRLFLDLRDVWLCGQPWGQCESSLDHMARALGVGAKAEAAGCDGATFAKLWLSWDAELRAKARAYLVNDLEMTRKVAERLGVV